MPCFLSFWRQDLSHLHPSQEGIETNLILGQCDRLKLLCEAQRVCLIYCFYMYLLGLPQTISTNSSTCSGMIIPDNMLYDVICNMYIRCISSGCFTCWGKKRPHHASSFAKRHSNLCAPVHCKAATQLEVSHLWLTIQGHIEFFTFPTKTSTWNISWNILGLPPHPGCQSPPGVLHL